MKYDTLWYPQDTATRLIEKPCITISCKARCILHSVSNCEYDVSSSRNFFFNRLGLINSSLAIRASVHSWAILLLITVQTRVRMFGCKTFKSSGIKCSSSRKQITTQRLMLFYVAFLHSEDSYSAIVAQLPEKQEYLCYSDERVMKKFFMCMKI